MENHLAYTEKLQDKLDKDLSWRKKEIIDLSLLIDTQSGETQITLIRGAITLLYAHWEGFIKKASILYLTYICKMNIHLSELTENFCYISLGKKFPKMVSVHSYKSQKALFNYIYYEHKDIELNVKPEATIDTESNLKFDVFQTITDQLGVDSSWFETKQHFINEVLLGLRNAIAHGEYRRDTKLVSDFLLIKENILEFIEYFKNIILESFEQKKFMRNSVDVVI